MQKEHYVKQNEELINQLCKDFKSILYTKLPLKVKLKMFYAAKYSAEYFIRINNHLILKAIEK